MLTLAIVFLIVFGLLLILLEFFVIPGVTIAGIGGFLLIALGVYLSYDFFGPTIGNFFLAGSLLAGVAMLVIVLRTNTWKRLGLKSMISSQVNENIQADFQVGDEGESLTRLAPIGKVKINDKVVEAKSISGFVDQHQPVTIVQVLPNMVIIKLKK